MKKLSIALATFNEQENIADCLRSVKDIASEVIIVDGSSSDKTVEIAKSFGAKVAVTNNPKIFHINKQKALDLSTNEWILQLDADERLSPELASEIVKIMEMSDKEISLYQDSLPSKKLFRRHQKLLEKRDGRIGTVEGQYVAFFIPRFNYFLGRYLKYGGVYPDGVIRLVKKGHARFPSKDVHEQMEINGRVGWLQNPLFHFDSPNLSRYIKKNNRYTDLMANDLKKSKSSLIRPINYFLIKPISWFILTYVRHKGFLDGWQGFVFSFLSSLRFPRAYIKYFKLDEKGK